MSEQQTQQINDAGDLRKYRIELPNLYDDAELDPYEFRLLAHYKRVGACFESTRTTAEKCKMSVGKVCEARDSLNAKGFIVIDEYVSKYDTLQITVADRWAENFKKYSDMKAAKVERSQSEQGVHVVNAGCSQGEPKKERIKEINTHTPEPLSEKEQCWNEVSELFPMGNAFDWEKWNNAWAMFPDKRRHDYAARRCRSANPRRFKFYLDDFMGFDPSKAVTWGDGKPAPIPKAPAKSPDPNRGIVTDEKRAELLREHQRLKALNKPQANAP